MNAFNLYQEVAALCSEGHMENQEAFYASLNRALSEVGRLDPIKKFLTLRHFPPHALYRLGEPALIQSDAPLTVSALSVAALTARGEGTGTLAILCDGTLAEKISFDGAFTLRRSSEALCGNSRTEITLLFSSSASLLLDDLVLYESDVSEDGEEQRNASYIAYDMKKKASDFLRFSGEIVKNHQSLLQGDEVILDSNRILIDRDRRGVYEIGYFALPSAVDADRCDEEIEIKREISHLVPLLTAYYVCVEDNDPKAEAFLLRYREALSEYRGGKRFTAEERVKDLYGW